MKHLLLITLLILLVIKSAYASQYTYDSIPRPIYVECPSLSHDKYYANTYKLGSYDTMYILRSVIINTSNKEVLNESKVLLPVSQCILIDRQ